MEKITSKYIKLMTKKYTQKGGTIKKIPWVWKGYFSDKLTAQPFSFTHLNPRVGRHKDKNPLHEDPKLIGRSDDANSTCSWRDFNLYC